MLIVGLDGTVINVALPTMASQLPATSAQLQWIGGGYLLALSVAMLPVGLLGDRYGHKRLLLSGITLFGLASLGGALATTPVQVITARAVLGLGAAAILPLSMAILPRVFAKDELPKAIAVWTGGHCARHAGRPGRRRLAAGPLLVGLGVPVQTCPWPSWPCWPACGCCHTTNRVPPPRRSTPSARSSAAWVSSHSSTARS
ncbi:hypothetical protein GCM10017687_29610 [Streptomyces echinatus]|uniref:MFS transporter n=1 Tax=Streptomyces echinatus TaxID=67293 RepID=UPI0031E648D2